MSRPLRVIHVVRAFQTGGLEMLALEMCRRVKTTDGVSASVCALLPGDGLERRAQYEGLACTTLGSGGRHGRLSTIAGLEALFRRERPDVVHLHNFVAHVRGGLAARLAGVPVVVSTKHGTGWPRLMGSLYLAGRLYRLADALVAVSEDVRQGLLTHYRLPPGRVRLVLNGIDTDRFRPAEGDREAARAELLGLTGKPLVGTVGRLEERKGVDVLLQAFGQLCERLPEAGLVIAGDGPNRARLESQAAEMGVSARVRFLGNRHDVERIYPLLDVFALPSYPGEGMPLTLLEAAACAAPTVATHVGGIPEVVRDGVSGRLVPCGDPKALAAAVLDCWERPDAARAMGRAARKAVVARFSLDRMLHDYIALYRELHEATLRRCKRKADVRHGT